MQLFKGVFTCTYYIKISKISAITEEKITGISIANLGVLMSDTYSLPLFEKNSRPCCFSRFSFSTEN